MPLNITPESRAAQATGQVINQINTLMVSIKKLRADGLVAVTTPNGNLPAVTPLQIDAALGPDIITKLDTAAQALN